MYSTFAGVTISERVTNVPLPSNFYSMTSQTITFLEELNFIVLFSSNLTVDGFLTNKMDAI